MQNYSLMRILIQHRAYPIIKTRFFSGYVKVKEKNNQEQIEYLKSINLNKTQDWNTVKHDILNKQGTVNIKNIDSIMLRYLSGSDLNSAKSFAEHLKSTEKDLSLGTINALLYMYCEIGKTEKPSSEQQEFILETYNTLYAKYKVLDYSTCERLLKALCLINEWEKALKTLDNIHLSTVPSHSSFSSLIATFFRLNKKKKAFEMIKESIKHKRPLQDVVYEEWFSYILRKYKDKKIVAKYIEEVFNHLTNHCVVLSETTANKFKEVYSSLQWNANFSRIYKVDGHCSYCKTKLQCLSLSNEEFSLLQQNVKEKLIIGSDLFLKTSPEELKKFTDFITDTAPYDIVLDGLNIAYAVGRGNYHDKLNLLNKVVDHFVAQNKKILLLGRHHMLKWQPKTMDRIMRKTSTFFTHDISQDDPYFITAAILSGAKTDLMSKDLLRGHKFVLKDESLRILFKRWQWQHQWMVFLSAHKGLIIQRPLSFTPCAQKTNDIWHVPFEKQVPNSTALVNDGTPDLRSWLCLSQK